MVPPGDLLQVGQLAVGRKHFNRRSYRHLKAWKERRHLSDIDVIMNARRLRKNSLILKLKSELLEQLQSSWSFRVKMSRLLKWSGIKSWEVDELWSFYGITTSKMMRSLYSLHGMMVVCTKAVFFFVFFCSPPVFCMVSEIVLPHTSASSDSPHICRLGQLGTLSVGQMDELCYELATCWATHVSQHTLSLFFLINGFVTHVICGIWFTKPEHSYLQLQGDVDPAMAAGWLPCSSTSTCLTSSGAPSSLPATMPAFGLV